jgi:hypothetical protein
VQKRISNKWLLNEWSTTKLFFSRKGYHLHHHHRLISEVPHWSIIDAGLQKVLTQSQLSGGLDDEPPSQILFATVQEVLTQSELYGGLEPSQILLTNLCCNVMLANGECFAGDIKDRVLHCQVTLVTFCMLGTCHSSTL